MKQRTSYIGLAVMIFAEVFFIFAWLWWRVAISEEPFVLHKPNCYPIISSAFRSVIDVRLDMGGELDALIWYCDADTGLEENYRVGSYGSPCDECFKQDVKSLTVDKLYELDRAAFSRPLKEAEQDKVEMLEKLYEPRCLMSATSVTTGVRMRNLDGTLGAVRVDDVGAKVSITVATAKPSCWQWIRAKAGDAVRYCSVTGQKDTLGREIGLDSYVQCKIAKAPAAGWPQ
jgi:hypothetical protein